MNANFNPSLELVLRSEGGFSDDPLDMGGATNHGVTQTVYNDWRLDQKLAPRSVLYISPDEVSSIYKTNYWDRVSGDDLPTGVDYATFDFGVNSGVGRAARYLEKVASVPQDGVIGPQTIAAVESLDTSLVIDKLCDMRLAYLQQLPTFSHFGNGWTNRVSDVRANAKAMLCA